MGKDLLLDKGNSSSAVGVVDEEASAPVGDRDSDKAHQDAIDEEFSSALNRETFTSKLYL
jgi:pantothenate kinase type III